VRERHFVVEVRDGPDVGKVWEILGRLRVGTDEDCEIHLSDPTISRKHALLEMRPEGVWVQDLQSKNGIYLRNARVDGVLVESEAQLRLGRTELGLRTVEQTLPLDARLSHFGGALGQSPVMQQLFVLLSKAAPSDAPILLLGETGSGKEVLASAVHQASPRHAAPFVVVDCASLPPGLAESELFGHVKGAFTGAEARREGAFVSAAGGTVFLDEIGELPAELQAKLLRALETRRVKHLGADRDRGVDVRIIAATHRPLFEESEAGRFRRDLYFRLAVVVAQVPPLRERLDDLPLLVGRFQADLGASGLQLSDALLSQLREYHWPGNIRELRNVVQRAVLGDEQPLVSLTGKATPSSRSPEPARTDLLPLAFKEAKEKLVESFARDYFRSLLEQHGGNLSAVARVSGVNRNHVRRLAERYGLRTGDDDSD
jgi:DNA-binding NtrC family response regulator